MLREENRTVGRFDSRFTGIEEEAAGECCSYDPSFSAIAGAYTATFNQYLQNDLQYTEEQPYTILANVWPWDFGQAKNKYFNTASDLTQVMIKNPHLHVFAATGYYDLATPFSITEYFLRHLGLEPQLRKNLHIAYYEAGHMMYNHPASLKKLKQDLNRFYEKTMENTTS